MTATAPAREVLAATAERSERSTARAVLNITRKQPVGALAALVCVLLVLVAVFATQLAPYQPDSVGFPKLHAPSSTFLFGTDNLFRDMYSRTIVGARISLGIGFASVLGGTFLGTLFGIVSGYVGGWMDLVINRVMDTVMSFPPLILAIFFLSIFRPTFFTVSLAIAVIITPTTARIVRGAALTVKELQYVEAAQALGSSQVHIMLRHVLPNVAASIIVIASIQIGNAILAEAALSFLGLGIATAAHPSWGKMLQDTRAVWQQGWWTAVVPGAAISLAVLSFNLVGDALRDVLDPRLRGT